MTGPALRPFVEVITAIRRLADRHPDRISGCTYFDETGDPVCIVGHAIAELGYTPPPGHPDDWPVWLHDTAADALPWDRLGIDHPDPTSLSWVQSVQMSQDGAPIGSRPSRWREAVDVADVLVGGAE